jgi:hypothetical protein
LISDNTKLRLTKEKVKIPRKCVSSCALSTETKFPMQIIIFLGQDDKF